MVRIARVVAPGFPHHITQRGNRRQETFFNDADYQAYIELMSEWCCCLNVEVWAYCLMPNHIHLIAVPESEDGLRLAIGEAHRRYTRRINFREGWRGHLWQGRFASYVMDDNYLLACVRYIEMNPVRAGLVVKPEQWLWSSASAHISGYDDTLVKVIPLLEITGGKWKDFLHAPVREEEIIKMRRHEKTGRPLGSGSFVENLETMLGRILKPKKAGRRPKSEQK
jgi:putative transposase